MTARSARDERPERVQSVERALGLLELVAVDEPARLFDLACRSSLPYATVHRLVSSMVELGYLRKDGDRRVRLGARVVWLGELVRLRIPAWASSCLRDLVAAVGETASLATLDGESVVYLAVVPSPYSVRTEREVGARVPAHRTPVGKVLLRRAGCVIDDGEWETGVLNVAAPVHTATGRFAVEVSGPSSRLTAMPGTRLSALVKRIAADAAALEIGSRPTTPSPITKGSVDVDPC